MNHTLRIIAALLAGLLAGGALGWLRIPAEVRHAPAPVAQVETADDVPVSGNSLAPVSDAPATAAPQAHTIRGVAKFADGSACAGLPLVAAPVQPAHYGTVDLQYVTPQARLEQHRSAIENLRDNARKAVTAADGSFEISGLADGEHTLYSDDRARPLAKRPWHCKAGDVLELEVGRALFIQLDVTREDGKPLPSARMSLIDSACKYHPSSFWSPGAHYEVAAGKWRIRAYGGPGEVYSADMELEIPPEGLDKPVPVVLKAGNALVINLGRSAPYYKRYGVRLVPAEDAPEGWPKTPDELVRYTIRGGVSHESDGTPAIYSDLAVGRYAAFCMVGSRYVAVRQEIDYQGGFLEVDVPLPRPARDDHIVVRVLGDDGRPIDDATVSIGVQGGSSDDGLIIASGGEYWAYRARPRHFFGLVANECFEYIITVTHGVLGRRIVSAPLDARDLEVRLGERATLIVHLDNLPEDRGALRFAAFPRGANEYEELNPRSPGVTNTVKVVQPRNEFKLHPGPVVVLLQARMGESSIDVYREEIELGSGTREIRMAVPPLNALRVALPAGTSEWVRISGKLGGYSLLPDKDGKLAFTNLAPGEYTVSANAGQMSVLVPHDGELVFAPQPYNGLRVRRLDEAGTMRDASLLLDDIVREVNGAPLNGAASALRAVLKNAGADMQRVSLRIQRAGQWQTLNVDAAACRGLAGHWVVPERVSD